MQTTIKQSMLHASVVLLAATAFLGGCNKHDGGPASAVGATSPAAGVVAPPPGDSTPKPADSSTRAAMEGNEKTGASGTQSTVGTAAAGAPPYTMNGAPEGNTAPSQGKKADAPATK